MRFANAKENIRTDSFTKEDFQAKEREYTKGTTTTTTCATRNLWNSML